MNLTYLNVSSRETKTTTNPWNRCGVSTTTDSMPSSTLGGIAETRRARASTRARVWRARRDTREAYMQERKRSGKRERETEKKRGRRKANGLASEMIFMCLLIECRHTKHCPGLFRFLRNRAYRKNDKIRDSLNNSYQLIFLIFFQVT